MPIQNSGASTTPGSSIASEYASVSCAISSCRSSSGFRSRCSWSIEILDESRLRDGLLLGAVVAAQATSSMYAAIFFVTYSAVLELNLFPGLAAIVLGAL